MVDLRIRLEPVAAGFERPVLVTSAADGSGDRYVVEQRGSILRLADEAGPSESILDISDRVLYHHERGLLGVAFHPRFATNGRLFAAYSQEPDGSTVLSEFRLPLRSTAAGARTTDASVEATERTLLVIPQPYTSHKGGMLAFDLDGKLLISVGDGGSGGDPGRNGLDTRSLLGKLLRIDVDGGWPYASPRDNGFAGVLGAHSEIHAVGLRNPWRFSVDALTGDVYIGDVGERDWEEINVLPRGESGISFGWSDMEGEGCYDERPCRPADHVPPAAAYRHLDGETSHCGVIGGHAYRGAAGTMPQGLYLFADYCSGTIWGAWAQELAEGIAVPAVIGEVAERYGRVQSFGQDEAGELYLTTDGGYVLRIDSAP